MSTGSRTIAGSNRNGEHKCTPKAQPAIQSEGRQQRGGTINDEAHKPTVRSPTTTVSFHLTAGGALRKVSGSQVVASDVTAFVGHGITPRSREIHILNSG